MEIDKKNLIFEAACATFAESGYEKSSIETISRRAGIAQGAGMSGENREERICVQPTPSRLARSCT